MVGALGGVVLGFAFLRRRSALGIAAAVLALGAFALLACGRPGDHRPLHDARRARCWRSSSRLALLGWRLLEPGHPWRRRWQVFAGVVAADVRASGCRTSGTSTRRSTPTSPTRRQIEGDLTDLVDAGAFDPLCGPIAVPNHRAVPRLAFGLDVKPTEIVSASEEGVPAPRLLRRPRQRLRDPQLHPRPQRPDRLHLEVPAGFDEVARNESWSVYRRC